MKEKNNNSIRILHDYPQKIKSQNNYFRKPRPKKTLVFLIILCIILFLVITILFIRLLSLKKLNALQNKNPKQKRSLDYYNDPHNYNNNETKDDGLDPIAIVIVVLYFFFLVLSLYIGCGLKSLAKSDEVFYSVLKYIYMANNGYLFISLIDNVMKASGFSIATLSISGIIFFVGTIIYLVKFCNVIFSNFFEHYFSSAMLRSWYSLPCEYIWSYISLTDPCCYSNTYTVYIHSDGTVTDDRCFVVFCNNFCFLVKRLSLLLSTLAFYIFLIMLTMAWALILAFYQLFKKVECNCRKGNTNINENAGNNPNSQNEVKIYGYRNNNGEESDEKKSEKNKEQNDDSGTNRKFSRNKSQIIPNTKSLDYSNNPVENLNNLNLNRRQSLNLSMNMRQLPNQSILTNQENNIYNPQV